MTDFLTRLAERSVDASRLVSPRPASLYEPRGGIDAPPPADELEVIEERVAAAPPAAAPPPGVVDAQPPALVEPPEAHGPEVVQPAAAAAVPPPVEAPSPAVEADPASPAVEDDPNPSLPSPATVIVQETFVERPEPAAAARERPSEPTPERPERPEPRTVTTRQRAVPARPPDAGGPIPVETSPLAEEPEALSAPPAPARLRVPAAQHDAEPSVVRVTIGRVDVRAVLPTARAERAAPRPRPRMTLDEYLGKDGRP